MIFLICIIRCRLNAVTYSPKAKKPRKKRESKKSQEQAQGIGGAPAVPEQMEGTNIKQEMITGVQIPKIVILSNVFVQRYFASESLNMKCAYRPLDEIMAR